MSRAGRAGSPGVERHVGDVRTVLEMLRRFDPRATAHLAAVGTAAFLSGLFEAAVLGLVTTGAVAATKDGAAQELGPIRLTPDAALAAAAVCLVLRVVAGYVVAHTTSRLTSDAGLAARRALLTAFHRASYERKTSSRVAALQERLTTYVDRFQGSFLSLTQLLTNALGLASFAVTALVVDPLALGGLAVVGVLISGVQRPFARRARTAAKDYIGFRSRYTESVTESVLLSREMTVFGVNGAAGRQMRTLDVEVAAHFRRMIFLSQIKGVVYLGLALGLVVAGLAALGGGSEDGLAGFAAVALIVLRSISYGQSLIGNLHGLSEQRHFVDELSELIADYEAGSVHEGQTVVEGMTRIRLEQVSLSYEGRPALEGVDLTLDRAETIGIVGPSGAGKTTLVNLILRLYEPTSGRITVDGTDIRDISDDCWHRMTAVVPQDARLLHGTVADNIRFLRDLPDEAVRRAAAGANIAEFVAGLPDGYESAVGEMGKNLSGGQRQRICIARALAGNPELLVLDEPTSALDGESEAAIQATLTRLKGEVTMVIIAHRLSTLSICDRIVVVERGRVVDVATPEELYDRSAYYRDALHHAEGWPSRGPRP